MKFHLAALLTCAFVASGCHGSNLGPSSPNANLPSTSVTFPDGKKITVEVANTPQSREIGLMFRARLDSDYGMLFVFPQEQFLQFWMKNTFVDLDMLFISADKKITAVDEDVPHSLKDTPEANVARRSGTGQYVLELPAGAAARHHLKPGDLLSFEAQ